MIKTRVIQPTPIFLVCIFWLICSVAGLFYSGPILQGAVAVAVVTICLVLGVNRLGALVIFAAPVWLGIVLLAMWFIEWSNPGGPGKHPALFTPAPKDSIAYFYLVSMAFLLIYAYGWWLGVGKHAPVQTQIFRYPSIKTLLIVQFLLLMIAEVPSRLGVTYAEFGFVFVLSFSTYVLAPLSIWISLLMRGGKVPILSAIMFQIFVLTLAALTGWRYLAIGLLLGTLISTAGLSCMIKGKTWIRGLLVPGLIGIVSLPGIMVVANIMGSWRRTGQFKIDPTYNFGSDFLLLGVSSKLFDWVEQNGTQWGISIADAMRQSVPTFIGGAKQRPDFLALVDSFGSQGAGMAVTSFAEIYTNLGLVIGPLTLLLMGFLSGRIQRQIAAKTFGPIQVLGNSVLVVAVLQIFQRGYLFSSLFLVGQIMLIMFIFRKLSTPIPTDIVARFKWIAPNPSSIHQALTNG